MTQKVNKATPITIKIGGLTNPRSFEPTDYFVVTTYDSDGASPVDKGYNRYAVMTIKGEITSVNIVPSTKVNGKLSTYTFTMVQPIPVMTGDRLKF